VEIECLQRGLSPPLYRVDLLQAEGEVELGANRVQGALSVRRLNAERRLWESNPSATGIELGKSERHACLRV
jgi:hypothetical protein